MAKISTQWDNIVRAFGMAFQDTTKDGIRELSDALTELEESGAIERWASAAGTALASVVKAADKTTSVISKLYNHLMAGRDFWNNKEDTAAEADDSGDFYLDREDKVNEYTTKRYYKNFYDNSERVEEVIDKALEKEYKKREAEEKKLAQQRERAEAEVARKRQALAEAQARIDERNAMQLADKKARAEAEAAERARREEEREMERLAREQERFAQQSQMQAANYSEEPSRTPHFGGRGDTPTSAYRENEAQISDLLARRQAYIRERYQEEQARRQERLNTGGIIDRDKLLGNPYGAWNQAVEAGKDQFSARLEALKERREWLEHQYANGMQSETSAQERTATACEKILSHFEGGRI